MTQTSLISKKDAVRELWYRGKLTYKLHDVQKKMLSAYIDQNREVTVIACSRRLGKSYLLCLLASEICIQTPNSIVKYVCPRKNMVKTILDPIMKEIFKDCPPEMRYEFKTNEYMYVFPNGSQIQMAGTDNGHHENLRGGKSDLWIVDEAGFCDELSYVVNTILAPTADTTGGRGIIASTPSKTADHDFISEFFLPAELDNALIKYTIYDNPMISQAKIASIINRYPDKEKDAEFRREYLCEIVNNTDMAIIPEFTKELEALVVKEVPTPPFYDAYVGMDIGGKDLTVVLFGYYDFKNARTIIQDELVFGQRGNARTGNEDRGFTIRPEFRIDIFAKMVMQKEQELWTNKMSGEFKAPYLRVADNNNVIFLNDLTYAYNLQFVPTRKDDKDAVLNTVRVQLADEKIIIHPRCKTLIYHLKNGTWAKNKKDFSRSSANGHWDAIPALMYLIRNIQNTKNPYPAGYGFKGSDSYFTPNKDTEFTQKQQVWVDLFKARKSIKR